MISLQDALDIVLASARLLRAEQAHLFDALNRVLAQDVRADMDMPPFNKSAMDGYACRRAELDHKLLVVDLIKAGDIPFKSLGQNECAKIMTGAMIPANADCVVMVEQTQAVNGKSVKFVGKNTRDNICPKGEDIRVGDVVLHKGVKLGPQQLAVLASVGCVNPWVARRPRVGIISTGDELVEPEVRPGLGQIRTSNSHQLYAQVLEAGGIPRYYGIAKDEERALCGMFEAALAENDVVLVSGGVSMGDFDFVPDAMRRNQMDILFDSIAVKPGRPTTFGIAPSGYCFGLPGNPVSSFIQFELLVKPFIYKLMGHTYRPPISVLPMAQTFTRKHPDRDAWVPVKSTDDGAVAPCEYHGSAHMGALCQADGLMCVPDGVSTIGKGTRVHVRPI